MPSSGNSPDNPAIPVRFFLLCSTTAHTLAHLRCNGDHRVLVIASVFVFFNRQGRNVGNTAPDVLLLLLLPPNRAELCVCCAGIRGRVAVLHRCIPHSTRAEFEKKKKRCGGGKSTSFLFRSLPCEHFGSRFAHTLLRGQYLINAHILPHKRRKEIERHDSN